MCFSSVFQFKINFAGLLLLLFLSFIACENNRGEVKAERLKNMGIQNYYQNNYGEALDQLVKSIKIYSYFPEAHFYRIKTLLEIDQIEKATEALDQYFDTQAYDLIMSFDLSMEFFNRNYYSEAIRLFDLVIELDPNHQNALINRGISFYTIDQPNKSYVDFTYVIDHLRPNIEVYVSRGVLLFNLSQFERAVLDFQNALSFDANDKDVHYYIGLSGLYLNDTELACGHIIKAIELGHSKANELYSQYCL